MTGRPLHITLPPASLPGADPLTQDELSPPAVLPGLRTRYLGHPFLFFASVPSTQDEAARAAAAGAPEGTVAVAHGQTAARGRFQRRWIAPPGSALSLSVVLRPTPPVLPHLVMIAALAVSRAIHQVTGLQAVIKWPNDILLGERKVCGILIETSLSDGGIDYAILGIGINVNLDTDAFPEIVGTATSLKAHLGQPVSRRELLQRLLEALEELYEAAKRGEPVFQWWRDRLVTLGRRVRVQANDGSLEEGVAVAVDETGALHLRRDDGATLVVLAGDVTLVG